MDHKNLMCGNFNTERVMQWRLILEEYDPELRYKKGENNIVANALSCLDMVPEPCKTAEVLEPDVIAAMYAAEEEGDSPVEFPLSCTEIAHHQASDPEVKKLLLEKGRIDRSYIPFR
jgi:hypothetical protein